MIVMSDIYGDGDRVERTLKLLRESDLSQSNRSVLEEFVYNLMAEDISDHKIYRYLQSFRSLEPVIESRILLDNWRKHKDCSGSGAIFSSFQGGNRIKYNTARKQLIKMAENAGVEKKVNPHAFRKSRATWMPSKGANIFQLMRFFGWSKSETALTYVRLAQSSVDELVLRLSRQSDLTEYKNTTDSLTLGSSNPEEKPQVQDKQALEALKAL